MGIPYLDHIRRESARVVEVLASADPRAPVPTCPGWTASDLLWHLSEVQWFWGTIVGERLDDPAPAEASKPGRPDTRPELVQLFTRATGRLAAGWRPRTWCTNCSLIGVS